MERSKLRMVLLVVTTAGFLSTFMASALNVALKEIEVDLNFTAVTLGWIQLAYILGAVVLLMPIGRLADTLGRKRVFLLGISAFSVLTLAGALAPTKEALIALRLFQGFATAALFACTTAMVSLAYPPEERGRAFGLQVGGVYLGLTLGPVLGGLITGWLGWRYIFVFVGLVGVIDVGLTAWQLKRIDWREPKRASFDVRGSIVWAIALSMLLVGFSLLPGVLGWVMIGAGAVGLAGFLWLETRTPDPVLRLDLFRRNRVFAFSSLASFINYAATYAMTFLMSLYLRYNMHLGPETAALVLVTGTVVQTVFSPVSGRLSDRVPPRYVASAGMAICVLGLAALTFLRPNAPYWYIIATLSVLGLGFGFFATPIVHSIMASVERRDTGVASAAIATTRLTGQSISIGLATLVLAVVVGPVPVDQDLPGLLTSIRITFAVFTGLCVIGVAASLIGPRKEAGGSV
jgi:EmrB/QacA subfamily drug resistance transporter